MAKKGKQKRSLGAWAFLIGVVLALILGLFDVTGATGDMIVIALILIGIVVGLLNVGGEETSGFLLAALALVIASSLGGSVITIPILNNILSAILILFVPTTIIVALKSVYEIAKD